MSDERKKKLEALAASRRVASESGRSANKTGSLGGDKLVKKSGTAVGQGREKVVQRPIQPSKGKSKPSPSSAKKRRVDESDEDEDEVDDDDDEEEEEAEVDDDEDSEDDRRKPTKSSSTKGNVSSSKGKAKVSAPPPSKKKKNDSSDEEDGAEEKGEVNLVEEAYDTIDPTNILPGRTRRRAAQQVTYQFDENDNDSDSD